MTLSISLPPDTEAKLKLRARAAGEDLTAYVSRLLANFAEPPKSLDELSGPIHAKFIKSGMTDEQLGDLLEGAKHRMRAERRRKKRR